MKTFYRNLMLGLLLPLNAFAAGGDDPLLTMVKVDQLETRNSDEGTETVLDGHLWIGYDLHKLWIKTEVEQFEGETEAAELQALYSRAVAPYWDLQIGVRRDIRPEPKQDWLVVGFEGLAPYFFETDIALFIGEEGRTAARLEMEYEFMFTQRLVLSPEIEINFSGKDEPARGIGDGLTDIEFGLRLRYEIRREFAPYIGINWSGKFGKTADYAKAAAEETSKTQLVAGIRFWF
ncbi:MAG: copper resistance protein B [Gammaproteobacteria bacterium]|nr:copper resistance protein B [Gammaproteobacteria bacterium]MDH5652030.1 copper resistance protein B [Gammaproteobacteria bacterium]